MIVKQAKFYILTADSSNSNCLSVEQLACDLAAAAWREGKKVLLVCDSEQQAFQLDEMLWQRDPNSFVPHNLAGESTPYPTPIEISWQGKRSAQRRDLLINLQSQLPDFINSFNQIVDFVPADEEPKALARERYKVLRAQNWQLSTENVNPN